MRESLAKGGGCLVPRAHDALGVAQTPLGAHLDLRSIELLREKRAALITAAVTGKIDVRNAA
jgi:hypothetical protein